MARSPVTAQRSLSKVLSAVATALLLLLVPACSHVAPYEREHLAKPGMDPKEREALRTKFYAHVYESREGAMPGEEHAGGGCGCN